MSTGSTAGDSGSEEGGRRGYDRDKIDECTLALLFLGAFQDVKGVGVSVWKGFDWEAMNRLHEKGYISDPKGKARSVVMTQEGMAKAEEMCRKYFK